MRVILKLLCIFISALLVFVILFLNILPDIATRRIHKKISSIEGLQNFNLDIQTISISGMGIRNITTGNSISIDSMFCYYTPASIMKKRVETLLISGVDINGVMKNSSFTLTDFSVSDNLENSQKNSGEEINIIDKIIAILPYLPPITEINHSNFNLNDDKGGAVFNLPFSVLCKIENANLNKESIFVKILLTPFLFGEKCKISINTDIRANIKNISSNNVDSTKKNFYTKTDNIKNLFNSVVINIHNISWSSINRFISIIAPKLETKFTGNCDISISMSGDISKWNIAISHIGMEKPIEGEINNVVIGLTVNNLEELLKENQKNIDNKKISLSISSKGSFVFDNKILSPLNIDYNFTINNFDKWSVLLKGKQMWRDKPFVVGSEKNGIKVKYPDFQIYFNGDGRSFDGKLTADTSSIIYDGDKIKTGKIDLKLPFKYLEKTKTLNCNGEIDIDSIMSIFLDSKIEFKKDSNLKAHLNYKINPISVTPDLIKKFYNDQNIFSGIDFNFRLDSNGNISFYNDQLENSLDLNICDGRFSMSEKNINISGIKTSLSFKGIPNIRPLAGQIITVDKIDIKDLRLSNIKIKYTIESTPIESKTGLSQYSNSLLIENASFDWCDGKVISESMRFSPKQKNYNLSLFCDRLKLSSVLKQIGSFDAEGDGTLNGRIPVLFSDGNISFDDGFLYSTPGQGGNIKVSGIDKFTKDIPKESQQFNQLELAEEALKNYKYDWAKLGFNSEGDKLIVKMEFDGKPATPLPFVYKKELGSFIKVNSDKYGSNFQGIKIDVNINLPFNKVLQFGNDINKLFN